MMLYFPVRTSARFALLASLAIGLVGTRAIAQTDSNSWIAWEDIFDSDPPVHNETGGSRGGRVSPPVPAEPGGSRGGAGEAVTSDDLCLIAPLTVIDARQATEVTQVGMPQPALVWSGDVEKVELRRQGNDEPLQWEAAGEQGYVVYGGRDVIMPGQVYEWLVYPSAEQAPVEVPFVTLTSAQQENIGEDLRQLPAADSLEESARQRADYFAERELWSDFWREVLLVENPSEALTNVISEAPERLCL